MHENKLLSLRELASLQLLSPKSFLGETLLVPGTINQIVGTDGVGKSFFAFDLACHIARGIAFGPFTTRRTNVLYVSEEMTLQELEQRRKLLISGWEFEAAADGVFVISKTELNLAYPGGRERLKALMDEAQAGVCFLDPISELHTCRENDNDSIRAMMKGLRDEISGPLDSAIVAVHHMVKESEYRSGKERSRGTYNQTCSDILTLDKDNENDRVIVTFPKVRHGRPPAPLAFRMATSEDGGRVTIEVTDAGISGIDSSGVGIASLLDALDKSGGSLSKKRLTVVLRDSHGYKPSRTEAAIRAALDARLIKRTKNGTEVIYVDTRALKPEPSGDVIEFPHGAV